MTDREKNIEPLTSPSATSKVRALSLAMDHRLRSWCTSARHEAATMLDQFIHLLQSHHDSVANSADILRTAETARDKLAEPSPRWHIVKGLLKRE